MISLHRYVCSTLRAAPIRFGLALLLAVASAGTARAATIHYSAPFVGNQLVSLPAFDPALGTLVSVTLDLYAEVAPGSITLENTDAAPAAGDVLRIALAHDPNAAGYAYAPLTADMTEGVPVDLGPLETRVFGLPPGSARQIATWPGDPSFLGPGALTFLIDAVSDADVTLPPSVNVRDVQLGGVSGTYTIAYEYVPEPALASLAACVLLGLLVRRR
jgi:hypothetical protein